MDFDRAAAERRTHEHASAAAMLHRHREAIDWNQYCAPVPPPAPLVWGSAVATTPAAPPPAQAWPWQPPTMSTLLAVSAATPATPADILALSQRQCDQYARCTTMLRGIFQACPAQLDAVEAALQAVVAANTAVLLTRPP